MTFDIFPKLNIFLKIIGFNGSYHQIHSRFVLAKGEIKDSVELKIAQDFCLKGDFGCPIHQNLIYKAVIGLQKHLDSKKMDSSMLKSLSIEVQKGIPKGAGLGGGSANAGMCLRKINEFFQLGLSQDELLLIASNIGADVAFFASGYKSANVYGIGEIIEAFDEKEYDFEIFTPNVFCDTKTVYSKHDEMLSNQAICLSSMLEQEQNTSNEILTWNNREFLNDLFLPALQAYPELLEIQCGLGDEWFFSGSGSSFFRLKDCS